MGRVSGYISTWATLGITLVVCKFTCRCRADCVDRNSIHFETRESQNVPPDIHNGSFRHINPPNNILFEILQRFCPDEAIKTKGEGKAFLMQYSIYLPLSDHDPPKEEEGKVFLLNAVLYLSSSFRKALRVSSHYFPLYYIRRLEKNLQ